jgi:uncharacterized repeat protein (TIGR01451 family)
MSPHRITARSNQARWLASAILLLCALLNPTATHAAPLANPNAAPKADSQTFERWVDGIGGSDDDRDDYTPCTRAPDPDDDTKYIYHSCATLSHALAVAYPGDIIRVAGGLINPVTGAALTLLTYPGSIEINKNITIIGGYNIGFGNQIDPPRYAALAPIVNGAVVIKGAAIGPVPPQLTGEAPMEVRLETLQVTNHGIDILSSAVTDIIPRAANQVNVTLESVTVYSVVDGGSGINLVGSGNKLVATKTTVTGNIGSTGGGIYAGSGTLLDLGAGTMISNNSATNGGGIGASGALTITIGGGVTVTNNSATNGGGIYASDSLLTVGSDTLIQSNNAASGAGLYLTGNTNSISGATINSNVATTQGGGIYANGAPTLENLEIAQNQAQSGAGLFLSSPAGGSLNSSDILSNTASASGGGYYINGGAFTASSLTVQGNRAAQHGGGGYVTATSNVTIQGNDFTSNSATNNGGGLFVYQSVASLQSSTYTSNTANSGGGLYVEASISTNASGNTFDSNSANYGGGLYLTNDSGSKFAGLELTSNHASAQGGGLYASNNTNTTIGSATFQGNESGDKGAGLYAINSTLVFTSSTLFNANLAGGPGGGGYLDSNALLTFETLDVQENEASAGGGFYADGGRATTTGATSFIGNKATSGNGGALYLKGSGSTASKIINLFAQNNEATNGGAFYADSVNLTLGVVNLTGNQAKSGNGGGVYANNSTVTVTGTATLLGNSASQNGGGIYGNTTSITFNHGAQFSGNSAQGGNGGGVYLTGNAGNTASFGTTTFAENIASNNGGALYASTVGVTVGSATALNGNIAQAGDGGGFYITGTSLALGSVTFQSNRAYGTGGGGYFANGNLSVFATTKFDDNRALTGNGGALGILTATTVLVDNALFTNNSSNNDGGALHITNSPLVVQNGTSFTSNTATSGHGGALYASGGSATLANLTLSKNKAGNGGGALYITTGIFSLQNSTLSENDGGTTTGFGGAVYLQATKATLNNNILNKNLANSGAGLYLVNTPSATLNTLQFTENSSSGPGAGLYLNSSTAGLNALTVRANQASGEGGGIYALYSRVSMTNTLIVANKVTSVTTYAAGVYVGNSLFNVTHSTIANNSHQQLQGSAHAFYVAPPITSPPGGAPTQSTLTLVNSIVSGQAVGVNLLAGNSATFNAVLWNNDAFNWTGAGSFSVARSRRGDPRFVAIASNDYHLRRDSAAFDQGVSTPVSVDREDVARTQGLAPDLGAYEQRYAAGLYLTTSISPAFVRSGDTITLRLRVQNQSASIANNVILRATLPSQFTAPNASSGSCQGIFCEVTLGTLSTGADVTVEIHATVNGTPLGNGLLTLLTNVTLQSSNLTTSDTSATATAYLQNCFAQLNGTVYHTVQAAMDAAANGQLIRISGVCGDVHQNGGPGQLLTINKNVTLQGGWNSTFTTLDPASFPTYLDSAGLGRVLYINGNVAPTIENLTIRNGNASALGGGPAGKDAGGGVYIKDGTPAFKNVDIANNQSPDLGGGVYLASPNVITFQGGYVRNNISSERGGGLYIDQSAPIFTGVDIAGNSARGGGGGYLYRSPAQFLDDAVVGSAPTCRIENNTSTVMPRYVPGPTGGGLPVLWLAPGGGGGLVLDESAAIVRGCAIHGNSARVGGGAYIHNSAATLENSLFTANRAQQPAPSAILIGPGGVGDGDGGGLVLDNQDPTQITLAGLLLGSNQAIRGGGMVARLAHSGTLSLPHFTINSNSGGSAIVALGESRLAFANTIVAFNTGGAAIFAQAGSSGESASITLDHTLWYPPTQTKTGSSGGGTVASTTEFAGDPAFQNDGYHLKRISAAYNVGANTSNFADRDGNTRPVGANVELGADEYATALTVRYVAVGGTGSAPCDDYRTPCASLQTALDAANEGDFIKMAGGTYTGVHNDGGRAHYALISKSVTIEGGYFARTDNNTVTDRLYTLNDWEEPHPVETPTIIDVNDQGRAFFISGNIAPTLSYLTLRRGNALTLADGPAGSTGGAGGAVYVDGASPIFKNVIVEESRALYGSGFYLRNASGSYSGVTARENGTGVSNGRGGGFYIEGGQPTFQGMTIQANIAITGAGIYLDNSAATLIQNTIQNNGDATTLDGGGLYITAGTTSLLTNSVASNQAQHGGGLRLDNSRATLRGNSINNNRAGTNPASSGQNDGLGGGLYITGGAPLVTANILSGNQAVHPALSYGGGVYVGQTAMTFNANTLTNNQAQRGGGLYLAATTQITLQNNTISGNVAQAPNDDLRASGGGVYFAGATITFTTNTLSQNSAPYGGGLYVAGAGDSQISHNTLTANTASKDGGGVYLDASDATLASNRVQNNATTGGSGGGLYARNGQATLQANAFLTNSATLDGGGLFLSMDGTTLQADTVQGNQAGDGGGIYLDGPAPGAAQAAPWVNNVTLANNTASNHGGALFVHTSGAQITLNTLHDNQAAVNGGGAYIQESTLAAFNSNVIRNNQAGNQGGGLYINRRTVGRYQSNAVIDNSAPQGGGIFVGGASPTFVNTTLARNGSGLVATVMDSNPTTVVLSNTIVAGHSLGIQGDAETTVTLFTTLWDSNDVTLFGSGNVSAHNDINGAANFKADGYHLNANSAAANKGIAGDVATGSDTSNDIDNEGRFQGNGPELGADELTAGCSIIVANSPNTVYNNLQQAVDNTPKDGEVLVAGSCTGVQTVKGTPQLAYFNQSITVRGGYALGSWDVSSPATQPTVLDAQGQGRAIFVASGARVTLVNLTIINGTAAGLGGGPDNEIGNETDNVDAGGNIYADDGQLTLDGVAVVNGRATVGGALFLRAPIALVTNSTFRNNFADLAGGAIYLDSAPTSIEVSNSRFTNNRSVSGGAIYALGGTPVLQGNELQGNQANGSSGRGGGIYLAASHANLNRNRLDGNRAGVGGALYITGGAPSLTNNMLISNVGIQDAGALYSVNAPIHLRHSTLVANSTVRSGGSAILFDAPTSSQIITLTNNILVDHSLAISVAVGNQVSARANLWNNNQTDWAGVLTEGINNLHQTDPLFINRAGGNYRLLESSPAVDHGVNVGVADDIDGQPRPARQGYDIGADEYLRPSVNATLSALPNPVASGSQQTYVAQVINNGDVDILARVQITLPAVLRPLSPPLWKNVLIARGAVWQQTLVATVDEDYTGPLSAVMVVTSDQGATASASAASTAAAISGEILEVSGESTPDPAEPGSAIELALRIVNHGAIPIGATIHAQLPDGLTTSSPLVYTPTIAGPDGIWSTRLKVNVRPDVSTQDGSGNSNYLVSTFAIQSDQGTSHTLNITTTLANPAIQVNRVPSPRPAIAGKQLVYTLFVTNTGNVALPTTISNTFPAQVALEDLTFGQPLQTLLTPGQSYRQRITTTVEAGYTGPLAGAVSVTTAEGVGASAQDKLNAQIQSLKPTATAKGGDWYDPASWEPPDVPAEDAIVLIPEGVSLYSNRPIAIVGLINHGTLELRTLVGSSQALTITNRLENYGEIVGSNGASAGQAGLTLNLATAILYNEGTICAGNGAVNGGAGGDLIIIAGSTTNKGNVCAGDGANVNDATANVPGGAGGEVLLSFDPGLFTNTGQVLGGKGGNSHPNAVPPQPGGNGGDVTIVATAAARLNNSDVRAGAGGQGSNGSTNGTVGQVVIGAPIINSVETRFSDGTVLLIDQNNGTYNFAAIGPDVATVSPISGLAIFAVRVFNRGALQDTFVATPLTTPTGWTVNNLPATLSLRAFRSNLIFVVITVPLDQVASAAAETFSIVISSQHDAGNQVVVPLRIATANTAYLMRLPQIDR